MKTLTALLFLTVPVWGNWSLVQSKLAFSGSAGTSINITMNSTPTVGNVIVVGVSHDDSATLPAGPVVDNQAGIGNSYSRIAWMQSGATIISPDEASLWCTVVNASSGTFTITAKDMTNTFFTVYAAEYSGGSCNPDQNNANSPGGLTMSPFPCGTITTTNNNDLLVSVISQNIPGSPTYTAPTGFTIQQQQTSTSGEGGAYADQIVSSTVSITPTWASTQNVATNCVVAALMAASGGGGGGGTTSAVFP